MSGEINLISYCNPQENIENFNEYYLEDGSCIDLIFKRIHKKNFLCIIGNIENVDFVKSFINKEVFAKKDDFPLLDCQEYYWHELIGLNVINGDNNIGKVKKLENHGASDLLFVESNTGEEIIPFENMYIKSIDLNQKKIIVDWEKDEY